jgi:pyrroloquinoline quinone biosynthesis protein B
VAVSGDGQQWFLLNAPPDLREQIGAMPALYPRTGLRSSPIAGVALSGGDVDAIAGLLTLRERHPFTIYATGRIQGVLRDNPIFNVLAPDLVRRETVPLDRVFALAGPDGRSSGLTAEFFAVPGKVPLYLEEAEGEPQIHEGEDTVGIALSDGMHRFFFIPGCAAVTPGLKQRLEGAELVLFDGTLWTDDEMIRAGLGTKTGRRMGHMSMAGPEGTMAALAPLGIRRKVFIHINNSNPVLVEDSAEHFAARDAGWEIAFDGMELVL